MSTKEIDRYDIIRRLIRKEINGTEAAGLIKLSIRQVKRLKAKVQRHGPSGLVHGNRGKASHNQLPEKEDKRIKELLHEKYYDFGPTLAVEKLSENHGIDRDPKTIRQIMIDEGLWKPKPKRKKQEYRQWRQRKTCYGEMEQFDGSYEDWFEDRADKCCLLASIDDATGKVTKAKFDKDEGVFSVFGFWGEYIEENGRPRAIYIDKFSTYLMSQQVAKDNHDTHTQFQRAMDELHIDLITAHSPQAKGRVERFFGTLQDRLIKELRLANISTIDKANVFLEKVFIPKFNRKFSIEPKNKVNLHRKLKAREVDKLKSVFSKQTERTVNNDFTISFNKQWYQLIKEQTATVCKKDKVILEERLDRTVHIRLRGKYLNYKLLPVRPRNQSKQPWVLAATAPDQKKVHIPAANHPWRRQSIMHKELIKV